MRCCPAFAPSTVLSLWLYGALTVKVGSTLFIGGFVSLNTLTLAHDRLWSPFQYKLNSLVHSMCARLHFCTRVRVPVYFRGQVNGIVWNFRRIEACFFLGVTLTILFHTNTFGSLLLYDRRFSFSHRSPARSAITTSLHMAFTHNTVLIIISKLSITRFQIPITEYPSANLHMNWYASFFKGCCFKNTLMDGYSVIAPLYLSKE